MVRAHTNLAAFMLAACFSTSAIAATPGKVLNTAVVDGFTVNILRFPKVARLPKPTSTSGNVTSGTDANGTSPYGNSPLAGSPFLSMDGGSVDFMLKQPASSVVFIWGSPDSYNYVNLYDVSGNLIGTLNGGDIANAFGFTDGQYTQIVSPTPIGSVSASSDECCFEVGNESVMGVIR
jgi:hypothetical protein